jgi:hypothetical protein
MRESEVGERKGKMNVLRSNAGTPHTELGPQIFCREEQSWISVCFPFLKHQIKKKLFPYGFILNQKKKQQLRRKTTTPTSKGLNLETQYILISSELSVNLFNFILLIMYLLLKHVLGHQWNTDMANKWNNSNLSETEEYGSRHWNINY